MARVEINKGSVQQAVNTADAIMETMEDLATKLREWHGAAGSPPGAYAIALAQLGEGLNAVNAILKTYSTPNIDEAR